MDLAFGLVDEDTLGEAILAAKVGVKIDLGLGNDAEVGSNDNCCKESC